MNIKVSKRKDLKTIFEMARTPEELEKLLKENGYISDRQLERASKLVNQRLSLLKRLK